MTHHIITFEIQTGPVEDGTEKDIAIFILNEFSALAEKHGFREGFSIEASWKKGCVLEHISLLVTNADAVVTGVTAAGTYVALKDYKSLRQSILLLLNDVRTITYKTKKLTFKVIRAVISEKRKPPLHERIEPTIKRDDNPNLKSL
ncbi:hypothetical protein [Agarivorans albus]|uniref:hypothetical protein n=1 Tax=Agarivorans albus TaxID=182262 RepID=UPI001BFDDC57|nr:hypothetical protein [Agarivorans albus]